MILSDERIYNQTLSALNVAFVDPLRALFEPSLGRAKHGPNMDLSKPGEVSRRKPEKLDSWRIT